MSLEIIRDIKVVKEPVPRVECQFVRSRDGENFIAPRYASIVGVQACAVDLLR